VREASECGWSSTPALRLVGYRLVLTPRAGSCSGIDPTVPAFRACPQGEAFEQARVPASSSFVEISRGGGIDEIAL
jgi:hypothetical protein